MADILTAGDNFRGYVVERLLGKGGLCEVYLVKHEMLDKCFALKVLSPNVASVNPEFVTRFVREAKIAAKIRHPNLVQVYDVGYDSARGLYFIVMDYINGWSLRMSVGMGGALKPDEAVRIVAAVAGALAAGEPFGVVHRDIKPENIMLENSGAVKLVDLGIAKAKGADSLVTMSHSVLGTPGYISPEQAQDASSVDFRADVYSLGIVFFELLCGRRPYASDKPKALMEFLTSDEPVMDVREINPSVPSKLSMIVKMMCAKKSSERLASASVVLDTLKRFGYAKQVDGEDAPSTSQTAGQAGSGDFDYRAYETKATVKTLSMDASEPDVQEFIKGLKRKRKLKKFLTVAAFVALAAALAALLAGLMR